MHDKVVNSIMSPRLKQSFLHYGLPFLSVLVASSLTELLMVIPNENRTMTVFFIGAVMISTWFGRFAAGLLASGLSIVSIHFFLAESLSRFAISWYDLPSLIIFGCLSLVVVYVVDSRRQAEFQLRAANEHLEQRVAERTSEIQKANRELQKANRFKDHFLAMVSHDLRTPLTSILGWVDIIERQGSNQQTVQRGISTIKRNAHLQTHLINDLLDVTRIAAGCLELNLQPTDVRGLVTTARERFQPTAVERQIALDISLDDHLANVRADPDRLARVLDNLISNALKFTPEGGRVVLQVERRADHLLISITDSGDGIAPEALPHVFDEFYQGTGDKKRQGVGLGLAIVKHIVNAHGGVVEAKSEGCGKGSTFTVMLPCEARPGAVKHSIATA